MELQVAHIVVFILGAAAHLLYNYAMAKKGGAAPASSPAPSSGIDVIQLFGTIYSLAAMLHQKSGSPALPSVVPLGPIMPGGPPMPAAPAAPSDQTTGPLLGLLHKVLDRQQPTIVQQMTEPAQTSGSAPAPAKS